ncbi:metabolite-proton symporter [Phyllobacterium trifolii]|uniref:Metabolite-proton symporter n=1 Tax=Phyllobacterium trifolii TaxID=300193 RepID=A0A839UEW1_9HYPH|nr:MFS transporter [Phyllobacterium trifolii]MBB3148485.1 metabolite-proton symporter [Phyllobacterium trifolii]
MTIETASGDHLIRQTGMLKRARLSSFIGTVIEWYDFFIYGAAAALVFGKLFFPQSSELAGTMAAFGTFAVGFVARPLGGIIFGHFGDRLGRRTVLVITLTVMGVSTFLIGLLPTFNQIGFWAPTLLIVMRIAQGIALGGEWGGAVLMVVEHAPANQRGWHSSWPQLGVPAGLVLSTGVMALFTSMPVESFEAWGWRVPFLISILLVAVGMFIRLSIEETPVFADMEQKGALKRFPALEILQKNKKTVLLAIGARFAENGSFFIFSVFSISYATKYLNVSKGTILMAVVIAALVTMVTIPLFASLTDRFGRRPIFMAGAAFTGLFAFPFFWLLQTGDPVLITLSVVLALSVGWSAMYAPQAAYFSELFEPQVRYSGMSIGAQLVAIVAGGPSPLIATAAIAATAGASWPISLWLIGVSLITLLSLAFAPETAGCDLGMKASPAPGKGYRHG